MDKIKVEPDLLLNLDRNINDSHSMIKCEAEEELTNNIVVKNEYDFYDNETFVDEGNFQSTQGISCGARAFVDRLLNDNVIRGSRAFQSAGYECINEEIVEYEQNYHSENQVLSKVKQESDSEESTILKKEIEFVDVQENNELVDHCLYDEKKIWNNITGGFEPYSQELETQPFNDSTGNGPAKSIKKKQRSVSRFNGYIRNLNNDVNCGQMPSDSVNAGVIRSTNSLLEIDGFECVAESPQPNLAESQLPNLAESQLPNLAESQLPNLAESQLPNLAESQLPNRTQRQLPNRAQSDRSDSNKFQCHLCEHKTNRKDRLREHIDAVHLDFEGFKCSSCDFRSTELDSVKAHLEAVHPPQKILRDLRSTESDSVERHLGAAMPPTQKTFNCDVCNCEFQKRSNLTSHVNSFHPDYLNCHMCDYIATKKSVLKRHVEAVHSKEKNFKCTLCEYRAYSKNYLKDHVESVHSEQKNFKCQMCDYGTNRKTHLAFHVNAVHLKRKDFKCQTCDYACSRKVNLKRHVEAVHSKQKNYSCKFCDYQAYSKFSMKVHTDRIHSREDSFKCNECSYETCMKSSLVTHVNIVHLKLKNYKCQLCDHATTRKGRLRSHMEAAHANWKEELCS